MSMKEELEIWVTALQRYDSQQFEEAIAVFEPIADTSKILFNCGVIRATIGEHASAVQYYQRATALDQYLAVAYFQQGVSNFLLGDFEEALANFNDALMYLRGNKSIDYDQLGLKYRLWSCEVMFNRGLCYIYLSYPEVGMADLESASREKAVPEHNVIDDAIREKANGYTVFSITAGLVFRPNDAKVKNIQVRDYLGKSKLVRQASQDAAHRRQISADMWAKDDRPADNLSYAASHLVKPNLRSRQQSEPPIGRNVFPPTPPPELEREPIRSQSPDRMHGNSRSLSRSKPEPLNLGNSSFGNSSYSTSSPQQQQQQQQQRRGTARSASERPSERRRYHAADRSHPDRSSTDPHIQAGRQKLFGSIDHTSGGQTEVTEQMRQTTLSPRSAIAQRQRQSSQDLIREEEEEPVIYGSRASVTTLPQVREDSDRGSIYSRRSARGVSMGKIRAKVHCNDETRYIMMQPQVTFKELEDQVAKKFAVKARLKLLMRDDENDMITMGDQDDLDMAVDMCRMVAMKEGASMGKVELWARVG